MTDAADSTAERPGGLLVSLCTFNERENIERLVPEVLHYAPSAHVLIVDDDSPDGTGEFADTLAAADERVRVLHRAGERGLGSATLRAFEHAIAHGYEWLINLDADFSHPPRYLPDLIAAPAEADVVIASRYVAGGGISGWPWQRHVMSRGVNFYSRALLGLPYRDCSGSYRRYRISLLERLDLTRIRSTGYAFQEEILYRCRAAGADIIEIPFHFEERRFGSTKINSREAARALASIFCLGCDRLRGVHVTRKEV